jgi:hypothetical protein
MHGHDGFSNSIVIGKAFNVTVKRLLSIHVPDTYKWFQVSVIWYQRDHERLRNGNLLKPETIAFQQTPSLQHARLLRQNNSAIDELDFGTKNVRRSNQGFDL